MDDVEDRAARRERDIRILGLAAGNFVIVLVMTVVIGAVTRWNPLVGLLLWIPALLYCWRTSRALFRRLSRPVNDPDQWEDEDE